RGTRRLLPGPSRLERIRVHGMSPTARRGGPSIMAQEPHLFATPSPFYPTRRSFLRRTGSGMGLLALAGLLDQESQFASPAAADSEARVLNPLAPRLGHFPTSARSVIWLFMNGGPSKVDTWDFKPELIKRHGQELPGFDKNTGFFTAQVGPLMRSP